ncbi:hypothetical protein [Corynebacterium pyruviciproducens]|uniref:hypothetical protein n=1 Tax=Corynebacterium pyruviciproducens TaxID=598660 RepID=UPI00254F0E85|nr:hypothetical protein [Corynebacterium pyruviciproducens]MDK7213395.1 hypothetical protein [Corynebacterium pyruviciproducens]
MDITLDYIAPTGDVLPLITTGAPGNLAVPAAALDGFTPTIEDHTVAPLGEPGASPLFAERTIGPMTGTLPIRCATVTAWHTLRRAFSTWDPGTLKLTIDKTVYLLRVRLTQPLPFPAATPTPGTVVPVPLISDRPGAWGAPESGQGTVTVTNWGDIPISPEILWNGPGGTVTLPSGATFILPAVTTPHRLPLARSNSGRIIGPDGPNPTLTRQAAAAPEIVPRGTTRKYTLPTGARAYWEVAVFDPFGTTK